MIGNDTIETDRFSFQKTTLADLWQVDRKPRGDARGSFSRFYCADEFAAIGLTKPLVQINHSSSRNRGTIRGLHFQHPPRAETKIVTCLSGAIFDVAVDLRQGSPTFLAWYGIELSAENFRSLVIPAGFAHGFQTLQDNSEIIYLVTAEYAADLEDGVNPFDPAVGVSWPLDVADMSERDAKRPFIDRAQAAAIPVTEAFG